MFKFLVVLNYTANIQYFYKKQTPLLIFNFKES